MRCRHRANPPRASNSRSKAHKMLALRWRSCIVTVGPSASNGSESSSSRPYSTPLVHVAHQRTISWTDPLATQLFAVSDNGELNLEGLTLTNASDNLHGGDALYAAESAVTVTDCVITGTVAESDGGAVYLRESHLGSTRCYSFSVQRGGR